MSDRTDRHGLTVGMGSLCILGGQKMPVRLEGQPLYIILDGQPSMSDWRGSL